jgi:TonB family protein
MTYGMSKSAIQSDWVGRVIDGQFTLVEWLGGSDSEGVFLTEIRGLPWQRAAIKLIPANAVDAEAQMAAWEATLTLSHPHLMHLIQTGRCHLDGVSLIYAVTEYTEEVLSQILPERPLTPAEVGEMLGPVVDALSYLHSNGMVHGHLTPSSILVVDDQVKISSIGLHRAGERPKGAVPRSVYDAPETAKEPISPAADVWSLGVTLIEALTQAPPVWGNSTQHDLSVPRSVPQPFAGIGEECLHANPLRRCTLSDIKARLDGGSPVSEPVIPEVPATPVPVVAVEESPGKRRGMVLAAVVIVLVAAVAMLVLRLRRVEPGVSEGKKLSLTMPAPTASPQPAATVAAPESQVPAAPSSQGGRLKGEVAERVLPDVLPSAKESIRGQVNVTVRVTVDSGGNISNATLDSPGPSRYFAKQALEAAQHWKFKPAQMSGHGVSSAWTLQFQFTQTGTDITPVEVSP